MTYFNLPSSLLHLPQTSPKLKVDIVKLEKYTGMFLPEASSGFFFFWYKIIPQKITSASMGNKDDINLPKEGKEEDLKLKQ